MLAPVYIDLHSVCFIISIIVIPVLSSPTAPLSLPLCFCWSIGPSIRPSVFLSVPPTPHFTSSSFSVFLGAWMRVRGDTTKTYTSCCAIRQGYCKYSVSHIFTLQLSYFLNDTFKFHCQRKRKHTNSHCLLSGVHCKVSVFHLTIFPKGQKHWWIKSKRAK